MDAGFPGTPGLAAAINRVMAGVQTTTAPDILACRKEIASAIFDPGATEGLKGERTLTEWQTDAVMRVLAARIVTKLATS
jgi:hypothetical protein